MKNNFAYFIASYGKPLDMPTLKALNDVKYPIYIVVGTDDPKLEEYKQTFPESLLVFDKANYIDKVDDIGIYAKTHKVCTYSRLAVNDFAKKLGIRYVAYLFDDIEYFQLRYVSKENHIKSIRKFDFDRMMDIYIKLLDSSEDLYFVGPPQSSFYIGVNKDCANKYTARYGNMFVYDIEKPVDVYRSSTLEDMDIVIANNKIGKMSICPFGLQVCCREPAVTNDCYGNMSKLEYYQHFVLVGQKPISLKRPVISYSNFTPKIISDDCRKKEEIKKGGLF